jgi:hypothetical protein
MITSINEFRKYIEDTINENTETIYPFTKRSETVEQAMEKWSEGDYDEAEIENILKQENDIYTLITMNIFIAEKYVSKNDVFCMVMNKILNITDTGQFMKETIATTKSSYHSEKVNIAFYMLLQKYTDKTFDAALNAINRLAEIDSLDMEYNLN